MKKILITGISGFVGGHLTEFLTEARKDFVIHGVSRSRPAWGFGTPSLRRKIVFHQADLLDLKKTARILKEIRPHYVVHLASFSSVAESWRQPAECFLNNTNIFLNLIESVRLHEIPCRILSVGSSEEYGPVSAKKMPLKEGRDLYPRNPYAVARVAQEQLSKVFTPGYGLDIICTRSFNHVGPGQSSHFVVSSFIRQALEVAAGRRRAITCGNLDIVRDFIDVRDVTRAYVHLLEKGTAGEIYNICRGQGVSLKDVLKQICRQVEIEPKWKTLPELLRPIDNPVIIGDDRKLRALGFKASYPLERSLKDMISWWKTQKS